MDQSINQQRHYSAIANFNEIYTPLLLRPYKIAIKLISGRVDGVTATETVDSCSIPGRVKPKL